MISHKLYTLVLELLFMPLTPQVALQVAQGFSSFYFQSLSGNRQALAAVYGPQSTLTYCNEPLVGQGQIGQKLMSLRFN